MASLELTDREVQYLRFVIRGDLDTLNDWDETDDLGDGIDRVVARRLLGRLEL